MKSQKIMFVAFSHTLTEAQKEDAKSTLGVTKFVTLREVNPELQSQFSSVPATATSEEIYDLAVRVVAEAYKAGAYYFYCTGEPSVTFWANFLAEGYVLAMDQSNYVNPKSPFSEKATISAVQSTTERVSQDIPQADGSIKKVQIFNHVQWRRLWAKNIMPW